MGLFDRIKKSLFGKKDEEDENKKEEKQTEQENEAKPESEDNDQESEKVVDEAKSKTETTDEEEQTVEAQEDSEVEAESGDEEKAVDLDSKQQPEEVKVEETTETETEEQLYEKGLEKTNKGFGARLNAFFAKFRTVDEDFFDDLEDLLIESDVGYETAEQLTDELREEAKLQNAKSRDDLKRVIVEKLVDLYDKGGNSEDEQLTYNAEAKPNVYLLVGVNGAGKTTTIGVSQTF